MKDWARRILGYDTETTGTSPSARLIEFGAVLIEDAKVVSSWVVKLKPPDVDWHDPSVQEALRVNGIEPADLDGCKQFHQEFGYIKSALTQSRVRCGHNYKFDSMILRNEFRRAVQAGLLKAEDASGLDKIITLDTLFLDLHLSPNADGRSLEAVAGRWGVHNWQRHTAIGDADACIRVLTRMSDHLPDDVQQVAKICEEMRAKWHFDRARGWICRQPALPIGEPNP